MKRFDYTTTGQKVGHFMIGFFGWLVVNALLWGAMQLAVGGLVGPLSGVLGQAADVTGYVVLCAGCGILLVNLGSLIYFGLTRYWIALGELAAFVGLLLLGMCLGVVSFALLYFAFGDAADF